MLKRFDEDGNWIEDLKSKWPIGNYDVDREDHSGMLVVWSLFEHEVLGFSENLNRSASYMLSGSMGRYGSDTSIIAGK